MRNLTTLEQALLDQTTVKVSLTLNAIATINGVLTAVVDIPTFHEISTQIDVAKTLLEIQEAIDDLPHLIRKALDDKFN